MTTTTVRLERAYLCLECGAVGGNYQSCDLCRSSVYPLARFLNRKSAPKEPQEATP
jgi:hypothetical protein